MFRAASAGTTSSVLVLFGYAQTALNEDAMFEFRPSECDKGLLPSKLMWEAPLIDRYGRYFKTYF